MQQYSTECGSIHPSIDSSGKWNTKNRIKYLIALKRRFTSFEHRDQKNPRKENQSNKYFIWTGKQLINPEWKLHANSMKIHEKVYF